MADTIRIVLDGNPYTVPARTSILRAAQSVGISIPTLCFHDFCTANALCRICVVEVEGSRTLVPACVAEAADGMKILTGSERVVLARRTLLEMLRATVDLSDAPEVLAMLQEYHADPDRFPQAERRTAPVLDDNPMYVRDYAKCIVCWRCVQVCASDAQYTYAINFAERGFRTQIATFYGKPMPETTCVFCGQCVGVCPTGALKPRREWLLEQKRPVKELFLVSRHARDAEQKTLGNRRRAGNGGRHDRA